MTAPLSPAAQAALNATDQWVSYDIPTALISAATLRVAADQIVPEDTHRCNTYTTEAIRLNRQGVRQQLLAIAAELEANRD